MMPSFQLSALQCDLSWLPSFQFSSQQVNLSWLLSAGLGVVGWLLTQLVIAPVAEYYRLRSRILYELVYYYVDTQPNAELDERLNEATKYNKISAAELGTLTQVLWPVQRLWLWIWGHRVSDAAFSLRALSNASARKERAYYEEAVRAYLNFPENLFPHIRRSYAQQLEIRDLGQRKCGIPRLKEMIHTMLCSKGAESS